MQPEFHPSSHNQGPTKGSTGSKEGLSVYGLFHHLARTPQGKYLLRQYFLRPTLRMPIITERLTSISTLIRPENSEQLRILNKSLAGIINVRKSMISLRKGIAAGSGKAGRIAVWTWSGLRKVSTVRYSLMSNESTKLFPLQVCIKLPECSSGRR